MLHRRPLVIIVRVMQALDNIVRLATNRVELPGAEVVHRTGVAIPIVLMRCIHPVHSFRTPAIFDASAGSATCKWSWTSEDQVFLLGTVLSLLTCCASWAGLSFYQDEPGNANRHGGPIIEVARINRFRDV